MQVSVSETTPIQETARKDRSGYTSFAMRKTELARHQVLLLSAFDDPHRCVSLGGDEWDILIRTARQAKLLGRLCAELRRRGVLEAVPDSVRAHLDGAYGYSLHRKHTALGVLWGLELVLNGCGFPLVLLKGASYIAQGISTSDGRLFEDIDIMVPKDSLAEVEDRLTIHGWRTEKPDTYDQRYYREWSHELPPMWHSSYAMELDVHHTILPVVARAKPIAERLLERAIPVVGSKFRVLRPVDQLVHASAHLFYDSDFQGRFKDLIDLNSLFVDHSSSPHFWDELAREAKIHGLARSVWYAAYFCMAWLGTTVPGEFFALLGAEAPGRFARRSIEFGMTALAFPLHPDRRDFKRPTSISSVFEARALWLRFPARILVYHTIMKAIRSSMPRTVRSA